MHRDIGLLADREFDLVIVGAGVYGAATAWDAALRGLSVALIDRGDFGGETSFNNLKTIHGGIRYLQHADFRRMRESVRERRALMRIAPHLVHPLPFLVPTYRGDLKHGRTAMRAALLLNDWVSWDRNRRSDPQKHLPAGQALDRDQCLIIAPGLPSEGLTGGILWHDAQMHNSDRVTLSFVLSGVREGAVAANYVEATGFLQEENRIIGVTARDVLGGTDGLEIRGRLVVNAAGPWVDRVLSGLTGPTGLTGSTGERLFHLSKAMNLVTRPLGQRIALGVTSRRPHEDKDSLIGSRSRFLCLIPWRNVSLIGTSHAPYQGEPDDFEAQEEDVASLLADVNEAYPEACLKRDDVRLIHRGLLPRKPGDSNGSGVTLAKSYRLEDHTDAGVEGLLSIVGVKYTTARDVAERVVDRAVSRLGMRDPQHLRSRSGETPVVGGDIELFDDYLKSKIAEAADRLGHHVIWHLVHTYGTSYPSVLACAGGDPSWLTEICEGQPTLRCEVRHAIREEMAVDLGSIVLRRTELGTAGHPGRACLEACAEIARQELGWSEERKHSELESVETFYRKRS